MPDARQLNSHCHNCDSTRWRIDFREGRFSDMICSNMCKFCEIEASNEVRIVERKTDEGVKRVDEKGNSGVSPPQDYFNASLH